MSRRLFTVPLSCLLLCMTGLQSASGQDANPVARPPQADELSRQLQSNAARGGIKRAKAIRQLARIGNWSAVDRWMIEVGKSDKADELAAWAGEIGPDMLLRSSLQPELSENAQAAIDKLLKASSSYNEDPKRLRQAIDQALSGDVNEKLSAQRILLKGGQATTTELISAIVSGRYDAKQSLLLQILKTLDSESASAVEQLALYGSPEVRPKALAAFSKMVPESQSRDTLTSAAFAMNATPEEREVAVQRLQASGSLLRENAVGYLFQKLQSIRGVAKSTANLPISRTMWIVDESGRGVAPNATTDFYTAYRAAYDAAQRLNRLGQLPAAARQESLAAEMEYRVIVDLDWGDPSQAESIQARYPESANADFLGATIKAERGTSNEAAVIGLIRLALSWAEADPTLARSFLFPMESDFSALAEATRDGHPRVRFEAATGIARLTELANVDSFPGASLYRKTLSEMASLPQSPRAIIVETRPEIAVGLENILSDLGMSVLPVSTTQAAEKLVASGGEYVMLLSKIQLADSTARELVDRIRRLDRGRHLPIVFFADADTPEKSRQLVEFETASKRWSTTEAPNVFLTELPGSSAAFDPVLASVQAERRLEPLSIGDRATYRKVAQSALVGR